MGGPFSCLLMYSIFCVVVWCAAGELATLHPVNGSFIHWAHRFIDPAAGVACGWNYACACIAFGCADIVAVTGLWQYWFPTPQKPYVSFCLIIFFMNAFAVKLPSSILHLILIIGFGFVAMLGGNPAHDRIGFGYWKDPRPMAE
ncbi:hypothetical protein VKT23_011334 [Stygiomarasmius scandens]|uniref:Amino acid permease/ SLC12A domain-containing protein n=1 Tax=Marasmiellus scandens TaxID=2682957 RepID=A0ABR1J970_9AGAR